MKLLLLATTLMLIIAAAFASPAPNRLPEQPTTTEFYFNPRLG